MTIIHTIYHSTFETPTTRIIHTGIRYSADYNISLFSTIIPIETNFVCAQWTYGSF